MVKIKLLLLLLLLLLLYFILCMLVPATFFVIRCYNKLDQKTYVFLTELNVAHPYPMSSYIKNYCYINVQINTYLLIFWLCLS